MSIENPDVESSKVIEDPRDEEHEPLLTETKSEVTDETGSGEDGLSSIPPEVEEEEVGDLNNLKLEGESSCFENDAKTWFNALSAKERSCAIGFVDGPFLSMILAMASWSPPAIGPRRSADGSFTAHGGRSHINWSEPVFLRDVESTYSRFIATSNDTAGTATTQDASTNDKPPTKATGEESTTSHGKPNAEPIDDFRIRNSVSSVSPDIAIVAEAAESPISSSTEATLSDDCPSIQSIFDHLSVVFPCVFELSSGSVVNHKNPYVTLQPSFLQKLKDEELFLALDAAMRTFSNVGFLSKDPNLEISNPWLDRLSQANDRATSNALARVPMYAIVLARMELSVFEAYREQLQSEPRVAAASLDPVPSADEKNSVPGDDVSVVDVESSSSLKEPATDTADKSTGEVAKSKRLPFDMQIESVLSYSKALHGHSGISANVMSELARPFVKVCFGPKSNYHVDINRLVVMPLPWVMHARSGRKKHDFVIDFVLLNENLRRVLKTLADRVSAKIIKHASKEGAVHVPSSGRDHTSKVGAATHDEGVVNATPVVCNCTAKEENDLDTPPEAGDTPPSSANAKKKKKKKKKHKSKKNKANSDEASATKETTQHTDRGRNKEKSVGATGDSSNETTVQPTPPKDDLDARVDVPVEIPLLCSEVSSQFDSLQSQSPPPPPIVETVDAESQASTQYACPDDAAVVENNDAEEARELPSDADVVAKPTTSDEHHEDNDAWETVEVRSRISRKKPLTASGSRGNMSTMGMDAYGKRSKEKRTGQSRRKNAARKLVRDILSSVLDVVDEEVRRKKTRPPPSSPRVTGNAWKTGPPPTGTPVNRAEPSNAENKPAPAVKQATLRDVVLGRHTAATSMGKQPPPVASTPPRRVEKPNQASKPKMQPSSMVRTADSPTKPRATKWNKVASMTSADQNTAPTYQETVSAVSATSNAVPEQKCETNSASKLPRTDLSSGDTDEAPQNKERVSSPSVKPQSPAPPLPTLLSPENANSATSSVASSLEVPHSSRRHHSASVPDVNDVGYHLLDVCDRLSKDMALFMNSRAQALNVRRRERTALLVALQETLTTIWPGMCHVEMYGSCATLLDLPSSDLDVLVMGLDRNLEMMMTTASTQHKYGNNKTGKKDKSRRNASQSTDDIAPDDEAQNSSHPQNHSLAHSLSAPAYVPLPVYRNAERVTRLAEQLESQPWAVKIKSIPYASVPVIKILADPSKLPGSGPAVDWMMHSQYGSQVHLTQGQEVSVEDNVSSGMATSPQLLFQPWRGSDVMNGLISLDITFEGPEHGGIGSTEFSVHVVNEACQEYGVLPEATPFVQCLMVLKELLAQRKLNEPYSGGLSSYALLLLLVSLVRERSIIREELERAELQRQAMTASDVSSYVATGTEADHNRRQAGSFNAERSYSQEPRPEETKMATKFNAERSAPKAWGESRKAFDRPRSLASDKPTAKQPRKPVDQTPRPTGASTPTEAKSRSSSFSSWACIAKKQSSKSASDKQEGEGKSTEQHHVTNSDKKPFSFADAVARSTSKSTMSSSQSTETSDTRPIKKPVKGESKSAMQPPNGAESKVESTRNANEEKSSVTRATETSPLPSPLSMDPSLSMPLYFPQGFNDVIEVLCSGETTAGKLLMHFLLYYGEHFDAQSTAIDLSGKHDRGFGNQMTPYSYLSPYFQRRANETIDPHTGMLIVDHIVVYDPLEGAENNNVARRCFAWSQVKWIFAQSYATLSSAVERSSTPPTTPGATSRQSLTSVPTPTSTATTPQTETRVEADSATRGEQPTKGDLMDPSSPLLRCLLAF